jgi:hypothetical protein
MRWWNEAAAGWDDIVPLGLTFLILMVLAAVTAVLWYTYPAWLPSRWRMRRAARRAGREDAFGEVVGEPVEGEEEADAEELPERPAEVYHSLADRYAAEGRWAEAVRERLRAIVRELVEREVIEHVPGWTVTELARAAAGARPELGPALDGATAVFSGIWYAQRPATADDDARMRAHLAGVHELTRGGR